MKMGAFGTHLFQRKDHVLELVADVAKIAHDCLADGLVEIVVVAD